MDTHGITSITGGPIITKKNGIAMASTEDHDHKDYEVTSGLLCGTCKQPEEMCAMCGISLHKCAQLPYRGPKFPKGFRRVASFPDYMVNVQAAVRHIDSGKYCQLVRVSNAGGAMITVYKDGVKVIVAAQDLRDETFKKE